MNSFIETLNQWGGNFLSFAWPMFWQSTLLIAALFAFDFLFRRRLWASIRYALWLVVLVKLCVPPTLALPTSPAWWLHQMSPPIVTKPLPHYTVTYDNGLLLEMPQTPLPAFVPPKPVMNLVAWLLVISASISVMLLVWLLVRWWQITRQVSRAKTSGRLAALADEAQKIVSMKLKLQVKLTTNSMSPAVCGLFRPAILIPQSLAENFSDEQLRAVLLHELIHLRRRDVWMNFLQALLQIFYWWHPLVWLANARIRRVREEAVDDAVMLALRDDAETYAPTLLEVAKLALNRPLASLGLVGILESRHALRQRIERLVDFRPPRKAGLTLVSLIGILAFTAVAVPMGGAPSEMNNPASSGVNDNLNQTNPIISTTANLSSRTNSFDNQTKADQLVQEAKLLYEMGKLEEAETKLKAAIILNPDNQTAYYYRDLSEKAREARLAATFSTSNGMTWKVSPSTNYSGLVQPASQNPNFPQLKPGRQKIVEKLNRIRLARVSFDQLSLEEVVRQLNEAAGQNDPAKVGVNFLTATNSVSSQLADINSVVINLPSPLKDVPLADILDAIILVADKPIKYSILDDSIVFSLKDQSPALFERMFKVDPNTFVRGLQELSGLQTTNASMTARIFFSKLGVDMESPNGKSVFYNDRLGLLFVKATNPDLDTIETAISALNQVEPQIRIKARFVEVMQGDGKSPGVDWYLGQFNVSNNVAGKGGGSPSLTVPVSAANPLGVFPGNTTSSPSGLQNSAPVVASVTGILTESNFRVALHALEKCPGFETLGEPEVITLSGRQTQMRATQIISVVTNFTYQETATNSGVVPQMGQVETGPILDTVAYVLSDGYTINLTAIPSLTEFLGYDKSTNTTMLHQYKDGVKVTAPVILPRFVVRAASAHVNIWDGQTVILGGMIIPSIQTTKDKVPILGDLPGVGRLFQSQSKTEIKKNLMVFVTATIVDPAGNRVHPDDEMKDGIPVQPPK